MRESNIEDLASHDVPEPCVVVREGGGEASTGVVQAGLLSREIFLVWGADAVQQSGRQYRRQRYRELLEDPAGSKNLACTNLQAREPGDPMVTRLW